MGLTITNTNIDSLAGAVASPYGPLTRVGTVVGAPTPNSDMRIEFTSALGATVFLSYEELQNSGLVAEAMRKAHDFTGIVESMKTQITALNSLAGAMSAPHTYTEYQTLTDHFRANFPWWRGVE